MQWGGVIIPVDGPLWYVRDLMVMVVVSPVIYWLIKRIRIWYVLLVGIVWYFSPFILPKDNYTLIYINMIVTAVFFFSIGAYFSIHKENFVMCFRKLKYVPLAYLIIAIADVMTKEMVFNSYIHKLGILLGIVSVVIMTSYLLEHKKIKVNATLANSSFFIFALHYMIITNIGKVAFILLRVPDNNPFAMLTLYFGTVIVTITICLVFYVLLKRYMPRTCNLLTGGR